jgi:hypothetical protein
MMRHVALSARFVDKFDELAAYLEGELKLSESAVSAYKERFFAFLRSLGANVDYAPCRFRRWRALGYRCAVFERSWVIAYEVIPEGVIVRDMMHGKLLAE